MKVEVVERASDQPSTVLEDLHLGEVEEVKTTVLPMVHKVQEEIILIPHIDLLFQMSLMWWNSRFFFSLCSLR